MSPKERTSLVIMILLSSCLFLTCEKKRVGLETEGGFPESPKNLTIFNSEYDDYNSDLEPGVYDINTFVFSSSRNSQGNDFDIMLFSLGMSYPFEEDVVTIYESSGVSGIYLCIGQMLPTINSSNNEFGPYIYNCNLNNDKHEGEFLFFYSQEESKKLNIKFMVNELDLSEPQKNGYKWTGPHDANIINTPEFSEEYISIKNDIIYYCSNCSGSYNIYQKTISSDVNIIDFLNQPYDSIYDPVINVNSDADDKCPYIIDDFMVFISNRPGGFGGYDLWYSKLINEEWNEPQNFGSNINTEFDEYRPIIVKYEEIKNDLMIFSSNRKDGFGGFDLYYVGIYETK